jgi:hypothetical protein
MQWSRLKAHFLNHLAPSLRGELDVHVARYRKAHDEPGRMWFTLGKRQILQLSDSSFEYEYYGHVYDMKQLGSEVNEAHDQARAIMTRKGSFARIDFAQALNEYLSLSVEDALASENVLHRALAVTDRRVGKRRLVVLAETLHLENPVVQILLRVRCDAESIRTPSPERAG